MNKTEVVAALRTAAANCVEDATEYDGYDVHAVAQRDSLMLRIMALAIEHGGGCRHCHGTLEVPYACDGSNVPCISCKDGISPELARLLAELGVGDE